MKEIRKLHFFVFQYVSCSLDIIFFQTFIFKRCGVFLWNLMILYLVSFSFFFKLNVISFYAILYIYIAWVYIFHFTPPPPGGISMKHLLAGKRGRGENFHCIWGEKYHFENRGWGKNILFWENIHPFIHVLILKWEFL